MLSIPNSEYSAKSHARSSPIYGTRLPLARLSVDTSDPRPVHVICGCPQIMGEPTAYNTTSTFTSPELELPTTSSVMRRNRKGNANDSTQPFQNAVM